MSAFTVAQRGFADAVAAVAKNLPARPSEPVLGCVKLTVSASRVSVSGYDYEVATSRHVDADDTTAGAVVVSGRLLAEVAKTFTAATVRGCLEGRQLLLQSGRDQTCLPVIPAGEYPRLPDLPDAIGAVGTAALVTAIKRIAGAADRTQSAGLLALTGIHLSFGDTDIQMTATDRYQAAISLTPWTRDEPGAAPAQALIPAAILLGAADLLGGAGSTEIGWQNAHLLGLNTGPASLCTTLMIVDSPVHPNLAAMFAGFSGTPAVLPAEHLRQALQGVLPLLPDDKANVGAAVLTFDGNELTVEAWRKDSSSGTARRAVTCEYEGPPMTIGFHPGRLLATLAAVGGTVVACHLHSPARPIMMTRVDEPAGRYRHLVMPLLPDFLKQLKGPHARRAP